MLYYWPHGIVDVCTYACGGVSGCVSMEGWGTVLGCVIDSYEIGGGNQKKWGRYQPPHGGWYLPLVRDEG